MKKLVLLSMGLLWIMSIHSCKRHKDAAGLSQDDISGLALADATTEEVINSVESFFSGYHSRPNVPGRNLPSCVQVSHLTMGDTLMVTWQFDTNGCQMPNGRIYSGTVNIQRIRDNGNVVINVAFSDDFSVDDIDVDGAFQRSRFHINANGNPETDILFDLTVTRPSGEGFHTAGQRVREMVEGNQTRRPDDNVWEITGHWMTEENNGNRIAVQTLTPLRKEYTCRWYVSGRVELIRNGETYTLDYGNGTCDDEAELTWPNGQTEIIHLH